MSFRNLVSSDEAMMRLLRDLNARLDRLENNGAIAGRLSFGPVIQIGDVTITIVNTGGNNRNVVFRNVLSGTTSTIVL